MLLLCSTPLVLSAHFPHFLIAALWAFSLGSKESESESKSESAPKSESVLLSKFADAKQEI